MALKLTRTCHKHIFFIETFKFFVFYNVFHPRQAPDRRGETRKIKSLYFPYFSSTEGGLLGGRMSHEYGA